MLRKSFIAGALIFLMGGFAILQAANPDAILGTWIVPKEDAKITVYKCDAKYCGKISWLKNPEDLDTKNPDPAKRKDKLLGKNLMWGFVFDGDDEWEDGKIYDPDSGDTYSCKMWMDDKDTLNVKGYIGISLFGRSDTWKRVK